MEAVERKPHSDREDDRGEVRKEPDEVAAMLRLKKLGWRLIGATVTVLAGEEGIVVSHAGAEVARNEARRGRRERAIRPEHLDGIVGAAGVPRAVPAAPPPELLRPQAEYERLLVGAW